MIEEIGNLPGYELLDSGLFSFAGGFAGGGSKGALKGASESKRLDEVKSVSAAPGAVSNSASKKFDSVQDADAEGYRLERFGDFILARPDPAAIWEKELPQSEWEKADAFFARAKNAANFAPEVSASNGAASDATKGKWILKREIPEQWLLHFLTGTPLEISFYARLAPFKHTGIFPEQSANWNFIVEQAKRIESRKQMARQNFAEDSLENSLEDSSKNASENPLKNSAQNSAKNSSENPSKTSFENFKVLSLFGYTGIASALCAKIGWEVTHVDASRPSISWAKENMLASGLPGDSIRWILEDALKFVKREARRGAKYNAFILDPPAFGRGAKGEVWKFNEDLPKLMFALREISAPPEEFEFAIVNAYAVSAPSLLLKNLLDDFARGIGLEVGADQSTISNHNAAFLDTAALANTVEAKKAVIDYGELILRQSSNPKRLLSTGNFGRLYTH